MEECWEIPLEFIRLGGIRFDADLASFLVWKSWDYERCEGEEKYWYAHIAFYEMKSNDKRGDSDVKWLTRACRLKAFFQARRPSSTKGYKTGLGIGYAQESSILKFASPLERIKRLERPCFGALGIREGAFIRTPVSSERWEPERRNLLNLSSILAAGTPTFLSIS